MVNFSHGRNVLIFTKIYLASFTYFSTTYHRPSPAMVALLHCVDLYVLTCCQRRYAALSWMDLRVIEIYETLTIEEFLI
jgi:hypothetical protein